MVKFITFKASFSGSNDFHFSSTANIRWEVCLIKYKFISVDVGSIIDMILFDNINAA